MQRRVLAWSAAGVVAASSAACSAIVAPDPARLGGVDAAVPPGVDAGLPASPDAFVPATDAWSPEPPDAWAPPETDAGIPPRPDAFVPPTCVEGAMRCEGETRVVCRGGVEAREDCAAAGAYCEGGACVPWACMPGSVRCSRDGSGVVRCDDRGTASSYERCPAGCDATTGSCAGTTTSCADLPTIALGDTRRIDLCAAPGDTTYAPAMGCGSMTRAASADQTFALTLRERTTVEIDLRDVDPSVGIDTVAYLRRACDDAASQLGCSDDVPCADSDITTGCSGGVQVRQSRFQVTLEAGTYYVVADAFRYDSFDCGEVELRVRTP
jgi:hypothetical protein